METQRGTSSQGALFERASVMAFWMVLRGVSIQWPWVDMVSSGGAVLLAAEGMAIQNQ
jgi:hypothetical protein